MRNSKRYQLRSKVFAWDRFLRYQNAANLNIPSGDWRADTINQAVRYSDNE